MQNGVMGKWKSNLPIHSKYSPCAWDNCSFSICSYKWTKIVSIWITIQVHLEKIRTRSPMTSNRWFNNDTRWFISRYERAAAYVGSNSGSYKKNVSKNHFQKKFPIPLIIYIFWVILGEVGIWKWIGEGVDIIHTDHISSGLSNTLPWRLILILRIKSSPICIIIVLLPIFTFPVVAISWGIFFVSSIVFSTRSSNNDIYQNKKNINISSWPFFFMFKRINLITYLHWLCDCVADCDLYHVIPSII